MLPQDRVVPPIPSFHCRRVVVLTVLITLGRHRCSGLFIVNLFKIHLICEKFWEPRTPPLRYHLDLLPIYDTCDVVIVRIYQDVCKAQIMMVENVGSKPSVAGYTSGNTLR